MANERVRQIYEYVAVSGTGKKQSAFGVFQPNADIDVRDKCEVTITDNVQRRREYDCDGVDPIKDAILSRDTVVTLNYNTAKGGFTPQIYARWLAYKEGVAAAPTGSTTNEVQTLTRSGTVSGGTFFLTLVHEGKTGITEPIAYDATNAQILAALLKKTGTANAMGRLLKSGDVAIGGTWGAGITVTFGGRFAATNVALFTVDNTLITGGGSVAVAQTTAGEQKVHVISRSTDGTLPLFSIVTGDKNGAYDHFKYGDAVVSSMTVRTEQTAGGLAELTVVIFCNYVPERESSFSVPACISITPLKVEDCRLKIAGTFETPDVQQLTGTFDNVVPAEAAHGYDDFDVTLAFQRGDQPTNEFTASIYGSPNTTLYQTAEAEETDGNDVEFILYLGHTGNRVAITGADTKIKFQDGTPKITYAGPLRQSVINIAATPLNSPPLSFAANLSQTATFLTASA